MQKIKSLGKLQWVDLTNPSESEIDELIQKYQLPGPLLLNSLDPEHLPQIESEGSFDFVVLRTFDTEQKQLSDNIRGLTRKLAILVQGDLIITIHRASLPWLESIFEHPPANSKLLAEMVTKAIKTYDLAIQRIHQDFEELEEEILDPAQPFRKSIPQDLYTLKRRVTLMKRLLRLTHDAIFDLSQKHKVHAARDAIEKNLFQLEEVSDNLIGILSLQISIAGQKSNEIMRVLTVYSIVLMPLNLIAGIYGMNFEHMSELKHPWGYPLVLLVMLIVAVGILAWLSRKGWLQRPDA